jgi:hypothetical protein
MVDIVGATSGLLSAGAGLLGAGSSPLGSALPSPNILSKYASYTYVLSLSALTVEDINYPDISYKAGKVLPLICKSAGADPENRVKTSYGKYDFYIDNLTFESALALASAKSTSVSTVQFDVYEPYSIGVFMLALQQAAFDANFANWRDAPFLLTIEFRGNTETGLVKNIPFTARHIPIKFTTVNLRANEAGCKYTLSAYATQSQALTTKVANLKTDAILKGTTVQEVLQTGEQSLQTVINQYLESMVKDDQVKIADKVVILFPKEEALPSGKSTPGGAESKDSKKGATFTPEQITSDAAAVAKRIGVSETKLTQSAGAVNELGAASMGWSLERKGDPIPGVDKAVYDPSSKTFVQGKLVAKPDDGTLKFSQDMDITSVIDQVLLTSDYPRTALTPAQLKDGFRTWWRIETQIYYIKSPENLTLTGAYPRVIVYKVIPFLAHSSRVAAPSTPPIGQANIKKQIVKRYDYIYTGNNSEVLKFDIEYSASFAAVLSSSAYNKTAGETTRGQNSEGAKPPAENTATIPEGKPPVKPPAGSHTNMNSNTATSTPQDGIGGGGSDTTAQRAAKIWHSAINNPYDMINLELEIWGDPYWIINSGMGNYTSKPVEGVKDLNKDGSCNWQTSEVHIWVYFRSPLDVNQTTGLYDFKSQNHTESLSLSSKAGPAIGFSGIYCVNRVTTYFRQGQFRQVLKGYRMNGQEFTGTATPDQVFGLTPGRV